MARNPLAEAANNTIQAQSSVVYELLSETGKNLFFPKGILTQSAEAKAKAHRYNATIGIATEGPGAMYLSCVDEYLNGLNPNDVYPYAPSTGKAELRTAWAAKQREETPSLGDAAVSSPVVTNALTHALAVVGELFINDGDEILVPDKLWGNYRLTWETRQGARISTFPFFTPALDGFNISGFRDALSEWRGGKLIVVLNFPNNPSGYQPTKDEAAQIVEALTEAAAAGTKVVAVCDDAYYGMFYHDDCETESLFGALAHAHQNLLAIKVDGATKEEFVWGLRVGFITYGIQGGTDDLYKALEQKTGGAIRGQVSNVTHLGQTLVLKALQDERFRPQQAEKVAILRDRAEVTMREASKAEYADCWDVYPFNAGYFMCLRIKGVEVETLRLHLLDEHGLGAIALGKTDLRVAFSCLEADVIADVFARIAQGVRALQQGLIAPVRVFLLGLLAACATLSPLWAASSVDTERFIGRWHLLALQADSASQSISDTATASAVPAEPPVGIFDDLLASKLRVQITADGTWLSEAKEQRQKSTWYQKDDQLVVRDQQGGLTFHRYRLEDGQLWLAIEGTNYWLIWGKVDD